ncbi:lig_chan-Glu_bd domain-containing protein [Nephila pilipes]|uniref:Lig_chan-Glu_bd domain-containing protein n=1 Tax=Nephila pilipes TaxID=299642 RepID=A0A8X6TCZ0_NEPPI|nr:lig_chan-Glu_bd domain-containing protein [Nephila pilipes]
MTKLGSDYEVVTPTDGQHGVELSYGNWTGIIGMIYRGEADIGIGNLGVWDNRYRTVDFSYPYSTAGLHFCLLKSSNRVELFSFYRLFDFYTWMFLLGSLFLTAIVIFMISKDRGNFPSIILYLFGSFLSQALILHKQIRKWKIIFLSWSVFTFIMSAAYSGALLSFLTLPSEGKTVETFRELSEAVAKDSHRLYALRGALHVPFLKSSLDEHLKFLGNMIEKNNWFFSPDEMTHNPLKKKDSPDNKTRIDVVLGPEYIFKLLYNVGDFKSKVFISIDKPISGTIAIAFRKGFCCSSEVNKILTRIVNAGIYEKLLKEESLRYWFSLTSEERREMQTAVDRSLSMHDLAGAFALLSVGLLISFLVFLIEVVTLYI